MTIYFLKPRRIDAIKIGRSKDVIYRLRAIQSLLPYRIDSKLIQVSADKYGSETKAEALIHRALKKYKTETKKEWYILNEVVESLIRRLKTNKIYNCEEIENILIDLKIMKKTLIPVKKPRKLYGFLMRSEFIQSRMRDLGLNRKTAAERSGLTVTSIRDVLVRKTVSKNTAKKIAVILGCKLEDLVENTLVKERGRLNSYRVTQKKISNIRH